MNQAAIRTLCRLTFRRGYSSVGGSPREHYASNASPSNQREALDWLAYFQSYDIFVDLGLMQVSTAEAKRRGISPESLLEPCTNLRVGWQILEDAYQIEKKTYGPGQEALQHAISRYNTGDPQQGIANGYLARVFAAVRRLQAEPPMERR